MSNSIEYLSEFGVNTEIAQPYLDKRDRFHRDALAHPGRGGTEWRKAMIKTVLGMLSTECIRTTNPNHISKIFMNYTTDRYKDEAIPKTDSVTVPRMPSRSESRTPRNGNGRRRRQRNGEGER